MKLKQVIRANPWIIFLTSIVSIYCVYSFFSSYQGDQSDNIWQNGDKEVLVQKCVQDASETNTKHPILTLEYCRCSTIQIQENFTKYYYLEISKKSTEEQFSKLYPFISNCAEELKERIRLKEIEKNNES